MSYPILHYHHAMHHLPQPLPLTKYLTEPLPSKLSRMLCSKVYEPFRSGTEHWWLKQTLLQILSLISRLKVTCRLRNHFYFLLQLWVLRLIFHVFVGLKQSNVDKWCHCLPILNFAPSFSHQLGLQRRGHHQKNKFLFSHPKSNHGVPDNKEILLWL